MRVYERDLYAEVQQKTQNSFTEETQQYTPTAQASQDVDAEHWCESSGLVYLDPDRKRTENWMQGLGLQLPSDATVLGSIGSVSYPDGKVKIESVPYSQYMLSEEESSTDGRQYSFSESTVDKQDVISNLRAILDKGGDPVALRQYVSSLEQNTGKAERNYENAYHNNDFAEQNNGFAYQTAETAEQILEASRAQEISVEEYLEQNWERYDVDGQWNAEARKALEQEERGSRRRQYSISMPVDDEENNGYSNTNLELRGDPRNMPKGSAEWHAFNRSFANKTMDLRNGGEKEIVITTDSHIYLVTADGYMSGYADAKILITEEMNVHREERKEYIRGTDNDGKTFDRWVEILQSRRGNAGSNISDVADRRTAESDDGLPGVTQRSDGTGDPEGSEEDNSWLVEEYPPGALVYDGNGNSYRVNEEGLLVSYIMRYLQSASGDSVLRTANNP